MRCLYWFLSMLLLGGTAACGAMIQLIDVDVKLPAERPISFHHREIAIFNALYDTAEQETIWNDSLLINKVAEGFRNQLAIELNIDLDSISVFNHFCDHTPRGTLDDKEYIYSLSEQTGARILVLIDSLKHGGFEHTQPRYSAASEFRNTYITTEWQMVFRIFDMDTDRFTARLSFKDTLFWNILAKDLDSQLIDKRLTSSMPETAEYLGSLAAKFTQPQWETQERVLFFFSSAPWYKALEHAFMFEWEEAQNIWLMLTKENKNHKKVAYAAYNLAVASEMMGRFDLAKEWLDMSGKYLKIPEVKYYMQILDERKQQQRFILLQVE